MSKDLGNMSLASAAPMDGHDNQALVERLRKALHKIANLRPIGATATQSDCSIMEGIACRALSLSDRREGVGEGERAAQALFEFETPDCSWAEWLAYVEQHKGFRGQLKRYREKGAAVAKALATRPPVAEDAVERVLHEAQFLCDRLDNLDFSMDMDDFAREHAGHVDPSHSRLKAALAALSGSEEQNNG